MNDGRCVTGGQIYADIVTNPGIPSSKEKEGQIILEMIRQISGNIDNKCCYKYYDHSWNIRYQGGGENLSKLAKRRI